jgi:hypothetical protein
MYVLLAGIPIYMYQVSKMTNLYKYLYFLNVGCQILWHCL